jgi:exodeoxyribonuclease VII large subunit
MNFILSLQTMPQAKYISLLELQQQVRRALDGAFPVPVWIAAEIADLKVNGSGHCYMELVEKGGANSVPRAQARAVAWRSVWQSLGAYFRGVTGNDLAGGMKVLLKVAVSYHELYGFSLQITDIDPSYTLGDWQRQKQETIARLQADGVFAMNRELGLPLAVQRVAVISSAGAAGYRDFMQEIARYHWRFDLALFEAVMQGHATEESVVRALEAIAEQTDDFDAVVLIRGGGSQTDMAAFNSYRLCSHIAQFPLPVLTGIGHDKDQSVADMVAAVEFKTPTAVAGWLGERLGSLDRHFAELLEKIHREATRTLDVERLRLEHAARMVSIGATEMTRRLEVRLERLGAEVLRLAGEYFLRQKGRLDTFEMFVRERPAVYLTRQSERLVAMEQAVALRSPEKILELGFAIVRVDGRSVRDVSLLAPDQPIDITLARGTTKAKILK